MNSTATNVGGWLASEMRIYANNEFYNKLPEELRNVIKSTKVVSGHGNNDKNNERTDGNWESEDKIYLLSGKEVWDSDLYDTAHDKTRQLDYYKNLKVTTNNYSGAIKKNNGSSTWWLRAASSNITNNFLNVRGSGTWGDFSADSTFGFAPAFRIGEKN